MAAYGHKRPFVRGQFRLELADVRSTAVLSYNHYEMKERVIGARTIKGLA